ncbi:MAG TPA: alpha-rhamnosidase, partial [Bacteroidales bacterium]|nr:alpha-rhamnosidase [Bacteroidales bacterium]
MKTIRHLCSYLTAIIFLFPACNEKATIEIDNLRCEFMQNPVGIDVEQPSLSWEINANARGVKQTGYRVLVASSLEKLNADESDIWDSGWVRSEQSTNVLYQGQPLDSRATCYWKVKTRANLGRSDWSEPAFWVMAFTNSQDWEATWIGLDRSFPGDVLKAKTRLSAR